MPDDAEENQGLAADEVGGVGKDRGNIACRAKKLGTNQVVVLSVPRGRMGMNVVYDFSDFLAETDEKGKFVITFVPPGEQTLARMVSQEMGAGPINRWVT